MTTAVAGERSRSVAAHPTTDRAMLRSFLEQDRLYAAYAICDLADREFPRTRWGVATDRDEVTGICEDAYRQVAPKALVTRLDAE